MIVKLKEIVNSVENLKGLLEIKLPVKASYRINRIISKVNPILDDYNKKRNDLIKEFGEEGVDEKGEKNMSVKDPEKVKEFMAKILELLEVDETIDFDKLKIADLGDAVIAPKDLVEWVFTEE